MKKLLIFSLLFICLSLNSISQTIISPDKEVKELKDIVTKYTTVTLVPACFRMGVSVDTEISGFWSFYDATEQKQLKFTSGTQVLNFMYRNGWKLIQRIDSNQSVQYLMEKKE